MMLHPIQSLERSTCRQCLDHHLPPIYHIRIKTMKRLSESQHDVIGDVHYIVDRTQSHGSQCSLEPLGTFLNMASSKCNSRIPDTAIGILYFYGYLQIMVVYSEGIVIRSMQMTVISILLKPCIEVACHSIMRAGICPIGSNIHLNNRIAFQMVIFCCRHTDRSICRKDNNTSMAFADSYFIFRTNHS